MQRNCWGPKKKTLMETTNIQFRIKFIKSFKKLVKILLINMISARINPIYECDL